MISSCFNILVATVTELTFNIELLFMRLLLMNHLKTQEQRGWGGGLYNVCKCTPRNTLK